MAKDFRSDRIRTRAIIGTGSILSTKPHLGLIFYSASKASDYAGANTISFTDVGDDVWLYFDGTPTTSGETRPDGSSVLFGGDVVVSGTLWGNRSVVEVTDTVRGDFRAPNRAIIGGSDYVDGDSTTLLLVDPFTTSGGSNGNGTVSFGIIDGRDYPATQNTDVFFHVSGSRGVKDGNDRGLALFDGDVFVSGNLELSPESSFVLGGDLTVATLTLTSNTIKNSESENTLLLTTEQDIQSVAGVKVGNNAITGSDDVTHVFLSGSGDVGIERNLTVHGGFISGPGSAGAIHLHDEAAALDTSLKVSGSSYGGGQAQFELESVDNFSFFNINRNGLITENDYISTIQFRGLYPPAGGSLTTGGSIFTKATGDWSATASPLAFYFTTDETALGANSIRFQIDGDETTVSGSLKIHGGSALANAVIKDRNDNSALYFPGDGNVTVVDSLTVGNNLTVNGTLTTINTTNLTVSDALIEMAASRGGSNNTNGGIAIASGSSINDVSLVFGRGNINNTWRAGRKDTQDGTITDVSDSILVPVQAAGIQFDNGLYVTGSFGGLANHLTASSVDGGILLNANSNYGVTIDSKLDITSTVKRIEADGGNWLYRDASQTKVYSPAGKVDIRSNAGALVSDAEARITLSAEAYAIGTTARGTTLSEGFSLYVSGSPEIDISTRPPDDSYLTSMPTQRIVLSGSTAEADGGPVIILSSSQEYNGGLGNGFEGFISIGATQAEVDRDFTLSRHRDVRTLLSGAVGTAGSNTRGVTLVSGDLVISGNTDFKGSVAIGSIATDNLTLTSVGSDEPYLRFRNSDVQINRRTSDDAMVFIDGDLGTSKTLRDLSSLSVTDNTDVFTISGGEPSYIKTTGSFSFDSDDQYTTAVNGGNSDTYFYVSGSIGSADNSYRPGNGDRGTAVFGGDVYISGSMYTETPLFFTTLNTAYKTPDNVAYPVPFSDLVAGAGAVIDTDNSGIPLQLRNPNSGDEALLAITGSLAFEYSGGGSNARLHMQSDNAFEFHNSAGEVFRMTAGSSGTNLRLNNNNQVNFEDDSRFVYGLTQDAVKKLSLKNSSAGGTVQVSTNSGRMEVTGSLYPGADNTYDLGSNDYRWANIYTGDLHLQNERGDWTVIEEEDFLTLRNNKNGKRYKLLMELMDEE